jgi:asparagine synthase (glutamine-hydrolysing)
MCGIAFLYDASQDVAASKNQMARALDRLQHRGPDGQGIVTLDQAVLGHRRLAIIDLDASHQPMVDPTGRYTLTYNGEIYNYKEVRKDLEDKWTFRTNGDTEVLLAGLVHGGVGFLTKLEGMWAFALWDSVERYLVLARDRMGKKPLFYSQVRDRFACSSELPALNELLPQRWEEDIDSTADYFRYGYYLPGSTAYRDVYEVKPGHFLCWTAGGEVASEPYWTLELGRFSGTQSEAADRLRSTFFKAVQRRLVSDVEVGAFLSGGVDSSLVVSVLSKIFGERPKTFTIGFDDASYDERRYARIVAADCHTDHVEEALSSWDLQTLRRLILDHVGQPFTDSSILPTSLVSEVAARSVKVALSGDGGDELFSGYQRYQARTILRWYTRVPRNLRHAAESALSALPEPMAHHSRSILKKAHLFVDLVQRLDAETPYVAPVMYSREVMTRLAPELVPRGKQAPGVPEECSTDDIARMMTSDALIYLPQDILVKVDRASMAHSLESRAPFLDSDLVKLAFSMPRRWHRKGFSGKHMLRSAFRDLLPAKIWGRRKQGFGVPIHAWFRAELGRELEELVREDRGFVRGEHVFEMLSAHRERRRDHGYRLWQIFVYLLWRRNAFGPQ